MKRKDLKTGVVYAACRGREPHLSQVSAIVLLDLDLWEERRKRGTTRSRLPEGSKERMGSSRSFGFDSVDTGLPAAEIYLHTREAPDRFDWPVAVSLVDYEAGKHHTSDEDHTAQYTTVTSLPYLLGPWDEVVPQLKKQDAARRSAEEAARIDREEAHERVKGHIEWLAGLGVTGPVDRSSSWERDQGVRLTVRQLDELRAAVEAAQAVREG